MMRTFSLTLAAVFCAAIWLVVLEITAFSGPAVSLGLLAVLALPRPR